MSYLINHYSFYILLITLVLNACGSRVQKPGETPAESLYLDGVYALNDEDYLTAFDIFQEVKTKYMMTKYAKLADLRLADTELGQDNYIAAIDSYRFFISSHPNPFLFLLTLSIGLDFIDCPIR